MLHTAKLVSWTGEKTYWKSAPGHYRSVHDEALAVMAAQFSNASIRLDLVR